MYIASKLNPLLLLAEREEAKVQQDGQAHAEQDTHAYPKQATSIQRGKLRATSIARHRGAQHVRKVMRSAPPPLSPTPKSQTDHSVRE